MNSAPWSSAFLSAITFLHIPFILDGQPASLHAEQRQWTSQYSKPRHNCHGCENITVLARQMHSRTRTTVGEQPL